MIEVNSLSKSYSVYRKDAGLKGSIRSLFKREWIEKKALNDATFNIGAGEIVGLVGSNGAGKTTLTKMLAGIIHPSSGSASVLGYTPWERKNEFRKQIALIMGQKAQLWWDLPAEDCFLLLKEIYEIPQARFRENLDFLTNTLEVKNLLNIQIRRLSLGERMKMELIAALLHDPKVIYLDEPTIGLDITAQRSVRKFLREYSAERRPALILTSHYMQDIEEVCKRIMVLREGRFVFDGPLEEITSRHSAHKKIRITPPTTVSIENALVSSRKIVPDARIEGVTIEFNIERLKVSSVLTSLLREFPADDISVEEEDISVVIESLMRSEAT